MQHGSPLVTNLLHGRGPVLSETGGQDNIEIIEEAFVSERASGANKGGSFMLLAETAASNFQPFDVFMIIFTLLIAAGLIRLLMERPRKNRFAIGFAAVALLVFLYTDYVMISGW